MVLRPKAGGLANEFLVEDQSVGCGSLKSTDSRHLTRKASVNGLLDSLTSRSPQAEQAGGASLALKGVGVRRGFLSAKRVGGRCPSILRTNGA